MSEGPAIGSLAVKIKLRKVGCSDLGPVSSFFRAVFVQRWKELPFGKCAPLD